MIKIQLICLLFILSGCAAIKSQNCTENAGYEKGTNDARMGRLKLLSQFSMICSKEEAELAQKGYLKGYEEGSKNSIPTVNLTLKGGKIGLNPAFKCQINYQGKLFIKDGLSEPEARNNVLNECDKSIKGCFTQENNVSCFKN